MPDTLRSDTILRSLKQAPFGRVSAEFPVERRAELVRACDHRNLARHPPLIELARPPSARCRQRVLYRHICESRRR